jgi:hypothetical protein
VLWNNVNADFGLFVQDQWTLKRMTINAGVRYDYFNSSVPAQNEASLLARFALYNPPYVALRNFAPVSDVPNWKDYSPRLGLAYDLFGDGKTAFKVSVSRYVAGQTVAIADANNPLNTSVTSITRTWNDANKDFIPDCDLTSTLANGECGQMSNVFFGQQNVNATRYADDVLHGSGVRGYSWELSTGLQRELRPGLSVQGTYFRRWYGNFSATQNTSTAATDYSPYCVPAPANSALPGGGGNQICGFYDVNPNKFGQVTNLISQAGDFGKQEDVYDGLDFTTNVRLPRGITLQGGLNTGRERTNNCFAVSAPQLTFTVPATTSVVATATGVTEPRNTAFCDVRPPFQSQIKFFGVYPLPWWGLQTSATYQNLPGPQIGASYVATNAQIAPSLGRNLSAGANANVTVDLIPPGTLYGARANELDVNIKKLMKFGGTRISASVDVFNILNRSDILSINTRYGPLWLQPTNILAGRYLKFGAQFNF